MAVDVLWHLHFTDEPRLNPWLGSECPPPGFRVSEEVTELMKRVWGAHTASRVLAPDGAIENLVNNLAWCSFSIDPDVLLYLRDHAPNVHQRIRDADLKSLQRLGHGNAVATSFSGAVLPLLSPEAIRLDIELGIRLFEEFFHRKPEGFWCPEMAISNFVADVLLEKGIRFTFISPWQIQAVSTEGTGCWQACGPYPYSGYPMLRLKRPGGTLHLVAYHDALHRRTLEGHILHQSQFLEDALQEYAVTCQGVVADAHHGDHFGLTEPFADMCLADLIHRTAGSTDFRWLNGAALVQRSEVRTLLAKLRRGEGEFGTSWSCSHGLARWYRDCGCRAHSEPHWNQHWRAPFKDIQHSAFQDILQTSLELLAEVPGGPVAAVVRNYSAVRLPPQTTPHERVAAWALAFGFKGLHQSAWYHGDPLQNPSLRAMGHTLRALELLSPWLRSGAVESYLDGLKGLGSNLAEGAEIPRLVWERERRRPESIAVSVILHKVQDEALPLAGRRFWEVREAVRAGLFTDAQTRTHRGAVTIVDLMNEKTHRFEFALREDPVGGLSLDLTDLDTCRTEAADFHNLDPNEGRRLTEWVTRQMLQAIAPDRSAVYDALKQTVAWHRFFHQPLPPAIQELSQALITRRLLTLDNSLQSWEIWDAEMRFARENLLTLDTASLRRRLSHLIAGLVSAPDSLSDPDTIRRLEVVLAHARQWGIEPDLTIPQNILWAQLQWWAAPPSGRARLSSQDRRRQALLFRCATLLGIKPPAAVEHESS